MEKKDIGHLLKLISDGIKAKFDTSLREHDLTCSQLRILGYLNKNNGNVTQKQLEEFLGVSHPTVVGLINRLEKNGFVKTCFDKNDKRRKIIFEEKKAVTLSIQMENQRNQIEELLLSGLNADEINELERMLNIVYNNVKR
ncbi:MAG: MarR family transcriptional regulator [Clostridia bacterium]|nr:MarR family transcriptional regulator [Clostridia bacterium]